MPATPLKSRSIAVAIALPSTSALAPVYFDVTVTDGGTISGNFVMGRVLKDIRPRSVMNTEITVERMGLFINNSNMITVRSGN